MLRCYVAWTMVTRADDRDAYVFRVLLNCLRDSRRRRWWGERPTERLPDESSRDTTVDVDVADAVHRALAGLSKPNRDVVVLRYFANLSEQQAAEALGIAPGTVKSRLSRPSPSSPTTRTCWISPKEPRHDRHPAGSVGPVRRWRAARRRGGQRR